MTPEESPRPICAIALCDRTVVRCAFGCGHRVTGRYIGYIRGRAIACLRHLSTMNTSFDFSGKVALVTGGVSGVGLQHRSPSSARGYRDRLRRDRAGADGCEGEPAFAGIRIGRSTCATMLPCGASSAVLPRLDFVVNSAGMIRRGAEHDRRLLPR